MPLLGVYKFKIPLIKLYLFYVCKWKKHSLEQTLSFCDEKGKLDKFKHLPQNHFYQEITARAKISVLRHHIHAQRYNRWAHSMRVLREIVTAVHSLANEPII